MRRPMIILVILVGMATGGESAADSQRGVLWKWMQRAFAPSSSTAGPSGLRCRNGAHSLDAEKSLGFVPPRGSTFGHWVRRAMAPTVLGSLDGQVAPEGINSNHCSLDARSDLYAFCESPSLSSSAQRRRGVQCLRTQRSVGGGTFRKSRRGNVLSGFSMQKESPSSGRTSPNGWAHWSSSWLSALSVLSMRSRASLSGTSAFLVPPTNQIPLTESPDPFSVLIDSGDIEEPPPSLHGYGSQEPSRNSALRSSGQNNAFHNEDSVDSLLLERLGINQFKQLVAAIVGALKTSGPFSHTPPPQQQQPQGGEAGTPGSVLDRRRDPMEELSESLQAGITAVLNGLHLEHNWHHIQHMYQDSATWIADKAQGLQPESVRGALGGAGQATVALLGEVNRHLVTALEDEVRRLQALNDAGQATLSTLSHQAVARLAEVHALLGGWLAEGDTAGAGGTGAAGGALQGAVSEASRATMARLTEVNRALGALVEEQVGSLVHRFDRELLALTKTRDAPAPAPSAAGASAGRGGTAAAATSPASVTARAAAAAPPTVMVMDSARQSARRLTYGEAIPELLYGHVGGMDLYAAPMRVSLTSDETGNVFLAPAEPGRAHGAGSLPMSSDVLWLRQMAAYSQAGGAPGGACGAAAPPAEEAPVRVAAVTIPVNERGDVLITQRAYRGIYDGMWVFPGGHVDGGEALAAAGVREVFEETGIAVDPATLQPLAVWEGTVTSRRRQFCVVFFAAEATCGSAFECTMELQVKEVNRAVWVPRELVPRILDTHVLHHDVLIDGIRVVDGEQLPAAIPLSELQRGLGQGHQFALRAFLDARPEYMRPSP